MLLALLPSPLLGPAVWEPVAAALQEQGHDARPVPLTGGAVTVEGVLADYLAGVPDDAVLVAHSQAGLYLPAVAARRRPRALVHVDAGLAPREGEVPTAPPGAEAWLAAKADADGLLPVWTRWWDEDLDPLFPDEATRRRVEAEQRRLPLAYFRAAVPVPRGWDDAPCAYVAFGDTYAAETAEARRRGWPVEVLPGEHLELLRSPDAVARTVLDLVERAVSR